MTSSRIKGPVFFLAFLLYIPGEGREDPVELIKRHRYEEAISSWDKDLGTAKTADEKTLRALKGKSLAYARLGSLYEVFQKFSTAITEQYYGDLIEVGASPLGYFYLGQIQYKLGKFGEAKSSFEKAKKLDGIGPATAEMLEVFYFHARRRLGETSGELNLSLKDNAAQWQALELKGAGLQDVPSGLTGTSQRGRRCKLRLLLKSPSTPLPDLENSLKAVLGDAQQPETYLDQGKNTQINFYDPFLMMTLSEAYYSLCKLTNLRIRREEGKFPDLAAKFNTGQALAEACLRLGQAKEAADYLGQDASVQGQLLRAQILVMQNKPREAGALLESLSNSTKNPVVKRDIADCYYLLALELDKGLKLAAQAVREKNGPNYYRTHASLLIATGQTEAAMAQFAKGYKIEYRNRIDQIDPEYMCDYAFAIFKTNKMRYEEIVETLYHLQKEFPACRQMHYCMQGISAGLARSYDPQRIFRKGG